MAGSGHARDRSKRGKRKRVGGDGEEDRDKENDNDRRRRSHSSERRHDNDDNTRTTDDSYVTSKYSNRDDKGKGGRRGRRGRSESINRKSTSKNKERNLSNSQKGKHVNAENKKTLETIATLRRKIKSFKKKRLGPGSSYDFSACAKCLEEEIVRDWQIFVEQVSDSEDFLGLTLRKPTEDDVMNSDEFMDLNAIAQRAQDFEIIVPEVRRKLSNCLNSHVYKYCKSLKDAASGDDVIVPAEEYEGNISKYLSQIEEKSEKIDALNRDYKQLAKPFMEFVKQGEDHTEVMSKLSNTLLETCKVVETWVREDDHYPDKLLDEVGANKKNMENLNDSILVNQQKKSENNEDVARTRTYEARAEHCYVECKRDKNRLRNRHAELMDRQATTEDKIADKQEARENLKEERKEKGNLSSRGSENFVDRIETVERELEMLELERQSTDRQRQRVEKDLKPTSDKAYEQKVEYIELRNKRQELEKENRRRRRDIEDIQSHIKEIHLQNETIQMIREMKLSPEAFRKGQRERRIKQVMESNGTRALTDACKYAAPSIGKDWKRLYLLLPFDPPRDTEQRHRDVENLDYVCARSDVTVNELALKSLTKWQAFHRRGNVLDLVLSLRTVKKRNVANEVEDKFALAAS